MKVKSRNMLRVPGWFNQEKKAVRSKITHKIYRSFAPVLISIKISNTRIIGPKIELPFNQFAIWLMREQIVTGPIWRPSHPSRVRGLKSWILVKLQGPLNRRTLHGCVDWNAISCGNKALIRVAPFTGAWIEISRCSTTFLCFFVSHPSRVRGLKLKKLIRRLVNVRVAPFTGAWIEMIDDLSVEQQSKCRTLHGCVDWNINFWKTSLWILPSHPSRVRGLKYRQIYYSI